MALKTIAFHDRTDVLGGPDEEEPPENLPEIRVWGKGDKVSLRPGLSDRPYILKMREKLRIAPGQKISFTAALPPLLTFELAPDTILAQSMPLGLPQTFFGPDSMNGELGFTLAAGLGQEELASVLIHCEVVIINGTKTVYEPGGIAIYPGIFNVYAHHDKLFADTLELEFHDTDYKTRIIEIKHKGYKLVSEGIKDSVGGSIVRRSADIIKSITNF
jgi:hypothetical protein